VTRFQLSHDLLKLSEGSTISAILWNTAVFTYHIIYFPPTLSHMMEAMVQLQNEKVAGNHVTI